MADAGLLSVGSHSVTHTDYDRISHDQAEEESAASREILRARTGAAVDLFAYPRAVVAHEDVVAANYRFAVAADGVKNLAGGLDPRRLARTPVRESDGTFSCGAGSTGWRRWRIGSTPGSGGWARERDAGTSAEAVARHDGGSLAGRAARLSAAALRSGRLRGRGVSGAGRHTSAAVEADGIRHVPVPSLTRSWTPVADVRALAALRALFRRERPEIVHTHNPKSGVLGRVAARAARVPVIVNTVHGLYDHEGLSRARLAVVARSERAAMRLSSYELFQSQEDLDRALRDGMVPASRASWLGNGVDLSRFDRPRVDAGARRAAPGRMARLARGRRCRPAGRGEGLSGAVRRVASRARSLTRTRCSSSSAPRSRTRPMPSSRT